MRISIVTAILFLLILIGATAIKCGVWNECRRDHSFFYCYQLVSG